MKNTKARRIWYYGILFPRTKPTKLHLKVEKEFSGKIVITKVPAKQPFLGFEINPKRRKQRKKFEDYV